MSKLDPTEFYNKLRLNDIENRFVMYKGELWEDAGGCDKSRPELCKLNHWYRIKSYEKAVSTEFETKESDYSFEYDYKSSEGKVTCVKYLYIKPKGRDFWKKYHYAESVIDPSIISVINVRITSPRLIQVETDAFTGVSEKRT